MSRHLQEADQRSRALDLNLGIPVDSIHLYPEIGAEVTGYARSDARRSGLHLMVDIGASTVDASTFTLFDREGLDNFSFLTANVQRLGAFHLHQHRLELLEEHLRTRHDPLDMVSPVPEDLSQMLPQAAELAGIDTQFRDRCTLLVSKIVMATKRERAPAEPQFRDHDRAALPVFVCGGGSNMKFYRDALSEVERRFAGSGVQVGRFEFQVLPRPPRLYADGLSAHEYHRLAVAYGLSFRYLDLAQ